MSLLAGKTEGSGTPHDQITGKNAGLVRNAGYGSNKSDDDTLVFSGENVHLTGRWSENQINPFDIVLPLQTPFKYDSDLGHLLIYMTFSGEFQGRPIDLEILQQNDKSALWIYDGRDLGTSPYGTIMRLGYVQVPEPSFMVVLIVTAATLIIKSR